MHLLNQELCTFVILTGAVKMSSKGKVSIYFPTNSVSGCQSPLSYIQVLNFYPSERENDISVTVSLHLFYYKWGWTSFHMRKSFILPFLWSAWLYPWLFFFTYITFGSFSLLYFGALCIGRLALCDMSCKYFLILSLSFSLFFFSF